MGGSDERSSDMNNAHHVIGPLGLKETEAVQFEGLRHKLQY